MLEPMILEAPSSMVVLWKWELDRWEAVRDGLIYHLPCPLTVQLWDNPLTSLLLSFFISNVSI